MTIVPMTIKEAKLFIRRHHRTHRAPQGGLFALGLALDNRVIGAAVVGRPVSRMIQANEPFTVELTRCATDGTFNACSKLDRAAWRAARALGWRKLITYTLKSEGGASLRGAGFKCVGLVPGGEWHRESRPRVEADAPQEKFKWEVAA